MASSECDGAVGIGHFAHWCHLFFLSWCLSFSVIGGQEQLKCLLALCLDRASAGTNRERSQFSDARIEPELGSSFVFGSSLMKDLSSKIEADVQVGKN